MNKKQRKERTNTQQAEKKVEKIFSIINKPEVVVKSCLSSATLNLIKYATEFSGDIEYTINDLKDSALDQLFYYRIARVTYNGNNTLVVQGVLYPVVNPNREAYRFLYYTVGSVARKTVNTVLSRLDGELRHSIQTWYITKTGAFPQYKKVINDHVIDELFVCKIKVNDYGYKYLDFNVKPKEVNQYKQRYSSEKEVK